MNTPPECDYDRVAYPSMAHPQTFAETLAIKGLLRGLDVAPPDRCRVLELGCGDGFNLAAMATMYPDSTYTGVDYSADAIERGRYVAGDLGLPQIRLEAADIRALAQTAPSLGEFDYIVAHGVYSWTPPDVRDALLAAIDRHLAPHGVAFVSYLALPGAHLRELVRTIMRFHSHRETDPAEKARQARAVIQMVARGLVQPGPYTRLIETELKLIEEHVDSALFHDELSEFSAPVLFTDFLAHASRHHLHFLSEAEYLIPLSHAFTPETRQTLRSLENNRVLLEQYIDFIEGRRFRQTLLCRPGLGASLAPDRVERLWASSRTLPRQESGSFSDPAPLEFEGRKGTYVGAATPVEKALMVELVTRQGAAVRVPELLAAARGRLSAAGIEFADTFASEARRYLVRASLPGLIDLSWNEPLVALTPTERPRAHPLALWLLERDSPTVPTYLGHFVEVNGALGRLLLSLLNGERDRAALLAGVRAFLAARHAEARAQGAACELPSPDDPAIPEQLEKSLSGLAGLGLLRR